MNTKYLPLDLKALRAEAREPEVPPDDPNVFTTLQYATDNGIGLYSARTELRRLLALGRVEPATKQIVRRGDRQPRAVPAWRLVKPRRRR